MMKTAYVFTKKDFDQFRSIEKVRDHLEILNKSCSDKKFLTEDIDILTEILDCMIKDAEGLVDK